MSNFAKMSNFEKMLNFEKCQFFKKTQILKKISQVWIKKDFFKNSREKLFLQELQRNENFQEVSFR